MYAGFWKRLAALIIDSIIIGIASMILMVVFVIALFGAGKGQEPSALMILLYLLYYVFIMIAPMIYGALFESSAAMATPGKMALGIITVDKDGKRLTFWRALGRNAAKFISGFTFLVGYILAGVTQRKQALHDMIADTLVVTKGTDAAALQPLPKRSMAYIVFMCSLPIILFILYFAALIGLIAFAAKAQGKSVGAFIQENSAPAAVRTQIP